jgi:hypothetical protein
MAALHETRDLEQVGPFHEALLSRSATLLVEEASYRQLVLGAELIAELLSQSRDESFPRCLARQLWIHPGQLEPAACGAYLINVLKQPKCSALAGLVTKKTESSNVMGCLSGLELPLRLTTREQTGLQYHVVEPMLFVQVTE